MLGRPRQPETRLRQEAKPQNPLVRGLTMIQTALVNSEALVDFSSGLPPAPRVVAPLAA